MARRGGGWCQYSTTLTGSTCMHIMPGPRHHRFKELIKSFSPARYPHATELRMRWDGAGGDGCDAITCIGNDVSIFNGRKSE